MTASVDAPARLSVDGAVATIALNRPGRLNAIDVEAANCLRHLGAEVSARDDVRVLVIEGRGSAFCAGGDMSAFAAHIDDPSALIRPLLDQYHEFLVTLRTMPKVVVTKLHGAVAGAGLSLAFMGDVAVAAADARFVPGYAKLGVSPDGGGTIGLTDRAGTRRALQIFLGTDSFTADQAARWGLVDAVVPRDELDAAVANQAARFARNAPAALAATKRLVGRDTEAELRARLEAERDALLACMATDYFRAAVHRFMAASTGRSTGRPT